MKKKIAIDCREFYKEKTTGIGRLLENFIAYAPGSRPEWEFLLLGSVDTVLPFKPAGNVSFRVIAGSNTQFWEQVRLPMALRRERCDLFFSPYYKTCFFSGLPSIVTIHDLIDLIYPGYTKFPAVYKRLMRLYAGSSAAVLTDSENSKRDIAALLGIPPGKIFVNSAGVDTSVFYERKNALAYLGKLGISTPYVLYLGNSNPHKNVDGLVKAYAALPEALRAGRRLVLAGVGDYLPPAGIAPGSFIKLAHVASEDLPFLYSGAGVFAFPSFYEGFGLPPLEAMACGCPVASSNTSCLPEILGDACAFFDPASVESIKNTLASLLSGPELRSSLRLKGFEQIKKHDPRAAASALAGLFDSVLRGGC